MAPSQKRYADAMRVLGIDVGEKRIGVALSDPTGMLASALTVVESVGPRKDVERVVELARQHEAECIVVGMPVSMDGRIREQGRAVEMFVRRLEEATDIAVDTWDERLTTVEADRRMIEGGASREKRREQRDAVAAAIMLQAYLDSGRS